MKKHLLSMELALVSAFTVYASGSNPYTGTAGVPNVQLNNGLLMPQFGLGTFLQPNDSVCYNLLLSAKP